MLESVLNIEPKIDLSDLPEGERRALRSILEDKMAGRDSDSELDARVGQLLERCLGSLDSK